MDSERGPGKLMKSRRMREVVAPVLGSLYLLVGLVQIMVSAGIMNDPWGIISEDMVSGFVLVLISVVFLSGFLISGKDSGPYVIVGIFLAFLHGVTGLLIAVSRTVSQLTGPGKEGNPIYPFLDPSIILLLFIPIMILLSHKSGSDQKERSERT